MDTAHYPLPTGNGFIKPGRRPWVLALTTIAIAASLLAFASWEKYVAAGRDTQARLSAKAQLVETQIRQLLRGANTIIDQIALDIGRTGQCSNALVEQLGRIHPEYRTISISDHRGIIKCASVPELVGLDRSVEDYARRALAEPETRGMVIAKPVLSKLSGIAVLPLYKTVSVPGARGTLLVQISINLLHLDQLLEALREQGQTLSLMHDSGVVLSHVPEPARFRLHDLSNHSTVFEAHRRSGERFSTHRMIAAMDGVERFFASTEVSATSFPIAPRGKLLVAADEAVGHVYAGWYRDTAVLAAGWLLLSAALITLIRGAGNRERQLGQRLDAQERKTEELLAANTRFLNEQDALDAHAIVSTTDSHGIIQYANTKFCEISGYTAHELLGKNHRLLNSGTHPPEFFQGMWRTISAGRVWHGLICNRAKDGQLYWVNSTIVPIRNNEGRIHKFISIRTEVTALIKAQEALRQSEQALLTAKEEAERQREIAELANRKKSEFLASMSHELRTPMNSILGFSQILEMEELGDEIQDYISHIHKSGQHLLRLINDLLDLSRIETGKLELKLEAIALSKLLEETVSTIAPMGQRYDVTVEMQPLENDALIEADDRRLRQVLLNLVSNAIKYNRPQGKVVISAQQEDGHTRILVHDTGVGMTAQNLRTLFEPYTRFAPANVEGTGIGLTITKRFVEAMGGAIGVDSTKDVGSTFWVEFKSIQTQPLRLVGQESDADWQGEDPQMAQVKGTVLYIEDNVPNQQVILKGLKRVPSLQLLIASAPYTGLQMATRLRPDLILLDINLPEFDGFEVFHRLRAKSETRHIPVIGISANAMPWDFEKAKATGFDDYLAKPVNIFALKRLIQQYLQRKAA